MSVQSNNFIYPEFAWSKIENDFSNGFEDSNNLQLKFEDKDDCCEGFSCSICHKNFSTKKNLSRHLSLHKNEKKYKCSFEGCNKAYLRSDHLKRHLISHSDNKKPFSCSKCIMRFSNKAHLKRHVDNKHSDNKPCGVEEGNVLIKEEKKLNCPLCSSTHNKKKGLAYHLIYKHLDQLKNISEEEFNKLTKNEGLSKNKLKLFSKINNICNCPFPNCSKIFTTKLKLQVHIKRKHDRVSKLCRLSLKTGLTRANLILKNKKCKKDNSFINSELLTFNKENKALFMCYYKDCEKAYSKRYNLDVHIKAAHLNTKDFECSYCNKSFKHKCSLKSHLEKFHSNDLNTEFKAKVECINNNNIDNLCSLVKDENNFNNIELNNINNINQVNEIYCNENWENVEENFISNFYPQYIFE